MKPIQPTVSGILVGIALAFVAVTMTTAKDRNKCWCCFKTPGGAQVVETTPADCQTKQGQCFGSKAEATKAGKKPRFRETDAGGGGAVAPTPSGTAPPLVVTVPIPVITAPTPAGQEKTSFDVILVAAGANKLAVIKEVKDTTGLGLAEAKALVDGAPRPIKEGITKAQADEIKNKIEALGARIEIR